jgi:hypothetical protein
MVNMTVGKLSSLNFPLTIIIRRNAEKEEKNRSIRKKQIEQSFHSVGVVAFTPDGS